MLKVLKFLRLSPLIQIRVEQNTSKDWGKHNNDNVVNCVKIEREEQESSSPAIGKVSQSVSTYLGHSIKVTDTENQCKVAHHTSGSFPGKSPKQGELISSEPKNAITYKDEGSKAMTVALQHIRSA